MRSVWPTLVMLGFGVACGNPSDDPDALFSGVSGKPISDWPALKPVNSDAGPAYEPSSPTVNAPSDGENSASGDGGWALGAGGELADAGVRTSDAAQPPAVTPDAGCLDADASARPAPSDADAGCAAQDNAATCVLALGDACVAYAAP